METGIMVEKKELFFLLSCRGCRSCPSIFEPKEKEDTEAVLGSLFRKGWITNLGDRFQVGYPLADVVNQIAKAKEILCLCHGNPERELLYLYPGERILAVQESFTRKNALRVLYPDRENFQMFLEEQGLLGVDQRWEALPYMDETKNLLPKRLDRRSELTDFQWIRLLTQILDGSTGEILGVVGIVRKGLQEKIAEEDRMNGSMVMEPYTAERFTEKLLKILLLRK